MIRLMICLLAFTWSLAFAQAPPEEEAAEAVQAEEQLADEADAVSDLAEGVETDPALDARAIVARPDEEFDPDEEISEDYPIPLPSDI